MATLPWRRRAYIPKGCDQQGRLRDGAREPEAAHAATAIGADDEDAWEPMLWSEIVNLIGPPLVALLCIVGLVGAWAWALAAA